MWYQGQERQLQDLFWDFNWHEIDGKESTTVSPDLTSAVRDKQNFTDKDLKCIWYSISHQLHIEKPGKLEILGMEPVFCSIQHPDLAGFHRWRNRGLGTHPMLAAQNQATSTRVSIRAPPPWRCHHCVIPLRYLETKSICWTEHPFQYSRVQTPYMEIRPSNLCSYQHFQKVWIYKVWIYKVEGKTPSFFWLLSSPFEHHIWHTCLNYRTSEGRDKTQEM